MAEAEAGAGAEAPAADAATFDCAPLVAAFRATDCVVTAAARGRVSAAPTPSTLSAPLNICAADPSPLMMPPTGDALRPGIILPNSWNMF